MEKDTLFIGICPPHLLEYQIHGIKERLRQKYGIQGAFRSTSHITLQMPFKLSSNKMEGFIHDLKNLVVNQKPIEVKLNDFGNFEPRVIYIKVEENEELNLLQKAIERFMKKFQIFSSTHKNNGFTPHITVAFRDLTKPIFYQIWDEVKSLSFEKNFLASSITIFKHNGTSWDILKEISLDPS